MYAAIDSTVADVPNNPKICRPNVRQEIFFRGGVGGVYIYTLFLNNNKQKDMQDEGQQSIFAATRAGL